MIYSKNIGITRQERILRVVGEYCYYFDELWIQKNRDANLCKDIQLKADYIIENMVELWGASCITNYFHYMESGHVYDYMMMNDGNIAIHANQGWEAVNGKFKDALKRKTQRSGHCGGGDADDNKKEEISKAAERYMCRRLIHFFHTNEKDLRNVVNNTEALSELDTNV